MIIFQDEKEVEIDSFQVLLNEIALPWYGRTECEARAIALGCQYDAYHLFDKMKDLS